MSIDLEKAPLNEEEYGSTEDSVEFTGWLKIKKPRSAYGKTKSYPLVKFFLSNIKR